MRKALRGCMTLIGGLVLLGIVIAVIAAATKGKSKPLTEADVTQTVAGHFIRSGCLGCENTDKISTSDVYCGWDGSHVIVHVTFGNSSSEILKVSWHPTYLILNGTSHGTGLTSMQQTKVDPGVDKEVFTKQSPKGTPPGTTIAKCYPSFEDVQAG